MFHVSVLQLIHFHAENFTKNIPLAAYSKLGSYTYKGYCPTSEFHLSKIFSWHKILYFLNLEFRKEKNCLIHYSVITFPVSFIYVS